MKVMKYTRDNIIGIEFKSVHTIYTIYTVFEKIDSKDIVTITWNNGADNSNYHKDVVVGLFNNGKWIPIEDLQYEIY